MTDRPLQDCISQELDRTAPEAVVNMAQVLAERGGQATAAVLYYGSTTRAESLDGVLDFYVLLDDVSAWPGAGLAHLANRLLPPNVGYVELTCQGQLLRAKYAVMSCRQFQRRAHRSSLDTTIWARFCQPSLCVWARSVEDRSAVATLITAAVVTAAQWAALLGPVSAPPADFWRALFARTYQAELRVEQAGRAQDIVAKYAERYAALLPLAWREARVAFEMSGTGTIAPALDTAQRGQGVREWNRRQRWGRPLNILRLLKAAFTFEGAMDYVVWKIERHRGVRIEVSPWQRRFPLLAAPGLYWRLRRRGILR